MFGTVEEIWGGGRERAERCEEEDEDGCEHLTCTHTHTHTPWGDKKVGTEEEMMGGSSSRSKQVKGEATKVQYGCLRLKCFVRLIPWSLSLLGIIIIEEG